jgi:predicted DNA binding CopG/RHH family protein
MKKIKNNKKEITIYDTNDTTAFIDPKKPKKLEDLGLKLPKEPPTTVVSIRLPTKMLNSIRAYSAERDISYQSVIKLFLQEELKKLKLL